MSQQIITKVNEVLAKAKELHAFNPKNLTIRYTTKGKAAGMASVERHTGNHVLTFSLEALQKHPNHLLNDTVPHEIAHLVCYVNPRLGRNHNPGWKRVCRQLGGNGERCHTLTLTPAKVMRKYKYVASCGTEVEVGAKHHKQILRGNTLTLRNTGGKITVSGFKG